MDCSILFTTFQTRRVWIRLGLTDLAIMRNAMDNWDPVSASVSGTHMSNQVSSSTNLLLQSRYQEDLGGKQSLSVSVFFYEVLLENSRRGLDAHQHPAVPTGSTQGLKCTSGNAPMPE